MSLCSTRTASIVGLGLKELQDWCASKGLPKYRALLALQYLYRQHGVDWTRCSTFDSQSKRLFSEHWPINLGRLVDEQVSRDGTVKWLWEYDHGARIESVLIPEASRTTLCISSQVGCSLSCSFCRTGTQRMLRNLTHSEIISQLLAARGRLQLLDVRDRSISNVVFMGQGEPLYNFKNVSKAAQFMMDVLQLGRGKITISTSGIAPLIPRVAEKDLGVQLAVSLHAPNNPLRSRIMAINDTYPVEVLIEACREFIEQAACARRRITFEYVLLHGVNDSIDLADELGTLLKGLPAHINLIPFNEWPGAPYRCSPRQTIKAFGKRLTDLHRIPTTIRWSRGEDIMAACGQLLSQAS